MFGHFGDFLKLARNESFQKFFSDPKVQALMRDEEFKQAVKEKNLFKLMANREFTELLKNPEIRSTLEEMRQKYSKSS